MPFGQTCPAAIQSVGAGGVRVRGKRASGIRPPIITEATAAQCSEKTICRVMSVSEP
jgi:hypothetical protein